MPIEIDVMGGADVDGSDVLDVIDPSNPVDGTDGTTADGEADDVVELGILLPMTGWWPVGRTIAGAAALAVERINTDASLLRGKRLKFTWLDDGCSSSQGQRSMTDLLRDSNITAVIGPGTERPTPSMRAP